MAQRQLWLCVCVCVRAFEYSLNKVYVPSCSTVNVRRSPLCALRFACISCITFSLAIFLSSICFPFICRQHVSTLQQQCDMDSITFVLQFRCYDLQASQARFSNRFVYCPPLVCQLEPTDFCSDDRP